MLEANKTLTENSESVEKYGLNLEVLHQHDQITDVDKTIITACNWNTTVLDRKYPMRQRIFLDSMCICISK